jgi:plasmid stabilization system protein ParE
MEMKIVWLEPALQRVQEIFDYYKEVAGEGTAQKIVRELYTRPEILVQNPQSGTREPLLENRPEEFRYLVEGNYKIIYYIDGADVLISTVFDCRQNPKILHKNIVIAEA